MTIKYIDIMEKDIYIEYTNNDFQYISFSKAKSLILKDLPKKIEYSISNKSKSYDFLNSLLIKYRLIGNHLILRQ